MCLKLSLLNPSHHFHSTCINRLLFLVVQVDLILNSHLWICPNPILELQHALLPLKCYELGNVLQLSSFSVVLFWDPPLGLSKSLGGMSLVTTSRVCKVGEYYMNKYFVHANIEHLYVGWKSFKVYHAWQKGPSLYCSFFLPYILIPIKNDESKVFKIFKRTIF